MYVVVMVVSWLLASWSNYSHPEAFQAFSRISMYCVIGYLAIRVRGKRLIQ